VKENEGGNVLFSTLPLGKGWKEEGRSQNLLLLPQVGGEEKTQCFDRGSNLRRIPQIHSNVAFVAEAGKERGEETAQPLPGGDTGRKEGGHLLFSAPI